MFTNLRGVKLTMKMLTHSVNISISRVFFTPDTSSLPSITTTTNNIGKFIMTPCSIDFLATLSLEFSHANLTVSYVPECRDIH